MTTYATAAAYFEAYLQTCAEFDRLGHDPHAHARKRAHEQRLEEEWYGVLDEARPAWVPYAVHKVRQERQALHNG